MESFNKPNLSAPRYRPEVHNILKKEFFESFKKQHPKYKNLDNVEMRKVIKNFNKFLFQKVIDTRDGVRLPESIGWLFIGTCQKSKKKNIDFAKSKEYGVKVTNKNWASDGKLAKIFFTNYATKHKIKNREFWSFVACREFKRAVAKSYPENWNMYVEVDARKKLKLAYDKKEYVKKHYAYLDSERLKTYNEFAI